MNAPQKKARRGQPLVVLGLLLVSWVSVRAVILEAGPATAEPVQVAAAPSPARAKPVKAGQADAVPIRPARPALAPSQALHPGRMVTGRPAWPLVPPPSQAPDTSVQPLQFAPVQPVLDAPPAPVEPPRRLSARIAAGHQMLYMAGLAQLAMPQLETLDESAAGTVRSPRKLAAPLPRWSGDGWLLLRRGGNGFNLPGAGLPWVNLPSGAYGTSQAGAVIRYRLAPSSANRPALYLRASSGLHSPRGEELAGGLMVRPLAGVPVSAMAELRATRTLTGTLTRPAVALVSELPPLDLPFKLKAETYLAGGYVGGKGGTPFIDGQARIERPIAKAGPFELSAGAGAWGGAQRGAQRLDVGPSATLAVPIGPVGSRLSADWRFRVVGNAAPGSGPALTLSAGF